MSDVQQFDFSVNLLKALLWEHDKAEELISLVSQKQDWYNVNQTEFWTNWYRDVFDLDTANDFGLSVWSRILNVQLSFDVPSSKTKAAFGFGVNHKNFNNGNFARGSNGEIQLNAAQKRIVLKLRYFQLITRGAVTEINQFLKMIFGDQGRAFVVDNLDMTATYFFSFTPDANLRTVLQQFDILPRPAAVGVKWQVQTKPSWGFGVNHLNFNNGNFGA